jgi:hypothetical protein
LACGKQQQRSTEFFVQPPPHQHDVELASRTERAWVSSRSRRRWRPWRTSSKVCALPKRPPRAEPWARHELGVPHGWPSSRVSGHPRRSTGLDL